MWKIMKINRDTKPSAQTPSRPHLALLSLIALIMTATMPLTAKAGQDTSRIVSIGGAVTEIIHALGALDHIVAVDTTSQFPEAARQKPKVGYMRALSPEGVLSMKPSLIVAIEGSGPADALKVLKAASVPLIMVPNDYTIKGVIEKIRTIAKIVDRTQQGEQLIAKVKADFDALQKQLARPGTPKRVMFALSIQNGRILAAGNNTSAAAMIKMAGAKNVFSGFRGYKPVSDEAIIAAAPDAIVVMTRGGGGHINRKQVLALPAIKRTPIGANKRVIAMNGLYLLSFGPRTASAARELANKLAK